MGSGSAPPTRNRRTTAPPRLEAASLAPQRGAATRQRQLVRSTHPGSRSVANVHRSNVMVAFQHHAGQEGMTKAVIVEPHEVVLLYLNEILAEMPEIVTIGTVADERDVLAVDPTAWDVAIVNLALPGRSGPEIARRLIGRLP